MSHKAESQWSARWNAALQKGMALDRQRKPFGRLQSIHIARGIVESTLQEEERHYRVVLKIDMFSAAEWRAFIDPLAPLYSAKLLAGDMPEDIETIFRQTGRALFPERGEEIQLKCTCPEETNRCRHSIGLLFLLGQELDRDPFLIFRLRGLDRTELFGLIEGRYQKRPVWEIAPPPVRSSLPESLPLNHARFWNQGPGGIEESFFDKIRQPSISAPLLKRLGNLPFWRGEASLVDILEPLYIRAIDKGTNAFLGKSNG